LRGPTAELLPGTVKTWELRSPRIKQGKRGSEIRKQPSASTNPVIHQRFKLLPEEYTTGGIKKRVEELLIISGRKLNTALISEGAPKTLKITIPTKPEKSANIRYNTRRASDSEA
jgi:hypothetical protein